MLYLICPHCQEQNAINGDSANTKIFQCGRCQSTFEPKRAHMVHVYGDNDPRRQHVLRNDQRKPK